MSLKEEIHSRISININFKSERKNFPTEQCKNDENRIRNKEVMTFWNFFGKHFLTSPYEYSNERVDVIPSQFSIHFIYRNDKNLIFQLWEYKTCLITTQSKWEIMFTLIHFDMGICFYLYELKMKNFQNFSKFHIQYIWKIVRGWHHQLAHLNIHKDWSRNVFRKKCEISKCHIFLIFHPIFIIFSL